MQELLPEFELIDQASSMILSANGKRVFLITGLHYESKGRALLDQTIPFTQYLKKGINVKEEEAQLATMEFRQSGADTILAIGGGSVIDLAKTIIYSLIKQGEQKPLFLAAPTTAGSGTEATHFAVIYQGQKKISLVDAGLLPDLVILDPGLTTTQSSYQTAVSGADVLCQAVESYWSKNANTESKAFSAAAIRLWKKYFHAVVHHPGKESREGMLQASHLAGKAINITRTTGPHALSYYLTSQYAIPHGQAVVIFLPLFFIYNQPGKDLLDLINARDATDAADKIADWMREAGLFMHFDSFGIDKKAVAPVLLDEINQERFDNNPVAFDREKLTELIVNYC